MQGDVTWKLTAYPLTPIHVGDGTVIGKDTYDIRDGHLCRFNPHSVIASADRTLRQTFAQHLDLGDLNQALETLRAAVDDRHIVDRLPLTEEARRQLTGALANPRRRGDVSLFVRTANRPYIPGSSIKGALRTALLSARVCRLSPDVVHRALAGGPDALQAVGLDLDPGATERDPLRDVHVPDVLLTDGSLVVDRVFHWKPGFTRDDELSGMQIHVERMRSRADDKIRAPRLTFTVTIASPEHQERRRALDAGRVPHAPVLSDELWHALRAFSWARFDAERATFWKRWSDVDARLAAALTFRTSQGPSSEAAHRSNPQVALIRLGRFGHFESKSVETYRQGEIPQRKARRAPGEEGGTRMLATVPGRGGEDGCVPFGWMMLVRARETTA